MTPETCFLRYAFPCVEIKLNQGKITTKDFMDLCHLALYDTQPTQDILMRCFPDAYSDLYSFGTKINIHTWHIATVRSYWRHHHKGASPVQKLYFHESQTLKAALSSEPNGGGTIAEVLNIYSLSFKKDGLVYVHQGVAIEAI